MDTKGTERQRRTQSDSPSISGCEPPYITSHGTHFLNVAHLGGIIGSSSMEGGLGLHLQSAVRWMDENTHTHLDIMEGERRGKR